MHERITVEQERRICMVGERKAFFHKFITRSHVVGPSPLRGGHPGGQINVPLALVEFEDGLVEEVEPTAVHFLDTAGEMAKYDWGDWSPENNADVASWKLTHSVVNPFRCTKCHRVNKDAPRTCPGCGRQMDGVKP